MADGVEIYSNAEEAQPGDSVSCNRCGRIFGAGELFWHRQYRQADDLVLSTFSHGVCPPQLLPVENMVLTIAKTQSSENRSTPPNTVAMLCMTIDRLAGVADYTQEDFDDG